VIEERLEREVKGERERERDRDRLEKGERGTEGEKRNIYGQRGKD
jgi:hypothetical protein